MFLLPSCPYKECEEILSKQILSRFLVNFNKFMLRILDFGHTFCKSLSPLGLLPFFHQNIVESFNDKFKFDEVGATS